MKKTVLVFLVLLTGGCAANHVIPDKDYTFRDSSRQNEAFRVAFDQDGNPYANDWRERPIQVENNFCFRRCNFQLRYERYDNFIYTPDMDEQILDEYAAVINEALSEKSKLVFFVHGYNNSYDEIDRMMEQFHHAIYPAGSDDAVIVEVVWDGLASAGWFSHWFKSLTYSNLAGQFGVRRLLNRIDGADKSLFFVTHSRGAGVAMSALFDPVYDSGIVGPNGQKPPESDADYEAFSGEFNKISLIMMAPALGKGHFKDELADELPANTSLTLVLKNRDEATSKLVMSKLFGTTVAGYDSGLVKELERDGVVHVERLGKDGRGFFDDHMYKSYLDKAIAREIFRKHGL
ncbi:MAG: hypothetical protein COA41_11430 [Sphingopyxis sp.]|nr:MAG: hypothetical protein COA41_11430 [Sphingopyxis sp.]